MDTLPSIFSRPGVKLVSQAAMADLGPGAHPRISIKGGRFSLVDAGGNKYPWPNLVLPVIIVGANPKVSKVYYEASFDPDVASPPTCYSDNGIAPSQLAAKKQARTCVECPYFGWGSDVSTITGKGTKMCHDKKKLAVLVVGDTAGHVYELQVSPASLRNLNKYAGLVGSHTTPDGSRKADLSDMVTALSFAPDQVGILKFDASAWIDSIGPDGQMTMAGDGSPAVSDDGGAAIAKRLDDIWESNVIDELVGLNDVPWTGAALPPPQAPAPINVVTLAQPAAPAAPAPLLAQAPFPVPAGAVPAEPRQAFPSKPLTARDTVEAPKRGGARVGAGRPPKQPVAPAAPPSNVPTPPFLVQQHGMMERQAAEPSRQSPTSSAFPTTTSPGAGITAAINAAFGLPTKQ